MKITIVAGGTGGHFYPGLAVAKELVKGGHAVRFILRRHDYAISLIEPERIPYFVITSSPLKRSLSLSHVLMPAKLLIGVLECLRRFLADRPEAVLAMGGYLSFPPAVAARLLDIPVFLHEQNVIPGLANRLLARLADRIAVSFLDSASCFSKKVSVTGNPVRPEFQSLPDVSAARRRWGLDPSKKTILIFGGSLGARRINELILGALVELKALATLWQLLHFSGAADKDTVQKAYAALPFTFHADAYCHEMPAAYAAADLVVCRSGAGTISELIAVKKPALLIPYPHASAGHQLANARVLEKAGTAVVCEEQSLSLRGMGKVLEELMVDGDRRKSLLSGYSKLTMDPFSAARYIAELIENKSSAPR